MFTSFSGDITSCSNLRQSSFQLERLKQIYEVSEAGGALSQLPFQFVIFR